MSLNVVLTKEEVLAGTSVCDALRAGVETRGSAVLLVPSFVQALDAQKELARKPGLALAVTTTTPGAWVKERWEVWGDGRTIADNVALMVLAREAVSQATPEVRGVLELSQGLVNVLVALVGQNAAWLPLDEANKVRTNLCEQASLTHAETCLMALAGVVRQHLAEHGFVSAADVSAMVPELLRSAGAAMPHIVVAGFDQMPRMQRELVRALAELTDVCLVICDTGGPASFLARELAASLGADIEATQNRAESCQTVSRASELSRLLDVLFSTHRLEPSSETPVELLLAAGPVAEAELIARSVEQLHSQHAAHTIVVAVPDVARARRELMPKLVARGVPARYQGSRALVDCPAAQAFLSFAHMVAHLDALTAAWPEPVEGLEGLVQQLGDMSWWPPRELSDFLLNDISHTSASEGWRADMNWRGNRLLSPANLLDQLQSGRDTSAAVAQATRELLKGRVGSAASRLLAPYVLDEQGDPLPAQAFPPEADEARTVLQSFLAIAGTLRELGLTADPAIEGAISIEELVTYCTWAAEGARVVERSVAPAGSEWLGADVCIMSVGQAASLAPGSVDALILGGLTTAESPVGTSIRLLDALLVQLGIEPERDPMACERARFRALLGVPRSRLVLERALHDADAKVAYPSVMLSELLAAYGIPAQAKPHQIPLQVHLRAETLISENLTVEGEKPTPASFNDPAPAGWLTSSAHGLVFVPQDGSEQLRGGKPLLSASQIETYLDCPYKWFSLRRLRLGTVDAGHGGMEMGTFAHRVLEVTHRELLARALEQSDPTRTRDELLAELAADPARHVAGSRVSEETLAEAQAALDLEFDLHQQHMYMIKRPRASQQLLVAHNSTERAQEDLLRKDLLSAMQYQTRILQGFEPRLFEWDFGRHGEIVEYGGAYFTGTVDRIDVSPHGTAVIIDYKHKSPAGFAAEYDALQPGVLEGEQLPRRVQSLIYAQVVRRAFAGRLRLVGSVYLSTKSPHALAGVADENVADQVFGHVTSRRMPQVAVPRTAEGESGMEALLDRTEELVAEQVAQMLAGNVEAHPRDKSSCDFCPVMQCERRVAR